MEIFLAILFVVVMAGLFFALKPSLDAIAGPRKYPKGFVHEYDPTGQNTYKTTTKVQLSPKVTPRQHAQGGDLPPVTPVEDI